jgi:hypothetical protein
MLHIIIVIPTSAVLKPAQAGLVFYRTIKLNRLSAVARLKVAKKCKNVKMLRCLYSTLFKKSKAMRQTEQNFYKERDR